MYSCKKDYQTTEPLNKTDKPLTPIEISEDDILLIIKNLISDGDRKIAPRKITPGRLPPTNSSLG